MGSALCFCHIVAVSLTDSRCGVREHISSRPENSRTRNKIDDFVIQTKRRNKTFALKVYLYNINLKVK